ncbi:MULTISPECIES: hypothetical protein [Rhizobium]|nr:MULTISPECIES: hypothetical protein [Rhizobium]MDQ0561017.1 hypothetical protein [Rhizobium mesoamericanum]
MTMYAGANGEEVNVPKPGASQNTWVLNVSGPEEPGFHPIA